MRLLWDRTARRDAVRVLFALTWLAVLLVNAVAGFYIELHENLFQGSGAAKDASFAAAHPIAGIFVLPAIAIGLLLVYYYGIEGRARRLAAWAFGTGLVGVVAGITLWTFADPSKEGAAFWIYIAGLTVSYLAIVSAAIAIRAKAVHRYDRSVPRGEVPLVIPAAPVEAAQRTDTARHPVSIGNMVLAESGEGGRLRVAAEVKGRHEEGEARLQVDEASRRMEWAGEGGGGYRGWLRVEPAGTGSSVTIHTRARGTTSEPRSTAPSTRPPRTSSGCCGQRRS